MSVVVHQASAILLLGMISSGLAIAQVSEGRFSQGEGGGIRPPGFT
jgi:hypothetical protein